MRSSIVRHFAAKLIDPTFRLRVHQRAHAFGYSIGYHCGFFAGRVAATLHL